jgi:cell fate (sporulation/competence/biofilm development) regulator YmcA (YheA/YmcA/DUF963 family)
MLTVQDAKLIERSLERQLKPIKTDIDAIQTRLSSVEKSASIMNHFDVSNTVKDIEKRMAAVENRISKTLTKEEFDRKLDDKFEKQNNMIVKEIGTMLKVIDKVVNKMDNISKEHDKSLDDHEKRLDGLENKVYV